MKNFVNRIVQILSNQRFINLLTSSNDVVLALFVIVIIGMIIIPISHGVLDNLIAVNLALSISVLMVALYIPKAVNLSIFPSLLLLTTLYRLGIEIAATRQILLHADAGKIIHAFGSYVVGGNFVVGIIIFLIITIVQFLVVIKGAERVAEVAARFTLDAMPGKQMSIDADLRNGVLDATQARDLRLALQKESQLYGAMDGAMKFVKGDVIAAIVIAVINIIGGLIIGNTMHGMGLLQAAQTYTLLTIGAGLISQIPSLMIALTAGIVTTRVSAEKKDANLGREISSQLLNQPKAIMISAAVVFAMGLIKGFPTVTFMVIAAILGVIGFVCFRKDKMAADKLASGFAPGKGDTDVPGHEVIKGVGDEYALTLPVILEVGSILSQMIKKEKKGPSFIEEMIPKMRIALYQDIGVRLPAVHVKTDSTTLQKDEYAILLNEVPISKGKIIEGSLLTNENPDNLARYNIPFVVSKNSLGQPSYWVEARYLGLMEKAGIRFWKPLEVMILHLTHFYRQYAGEFIGIQEVRGILEFLEKSYPDLVKEVTRLVPLQKMTEIFRRLVQEQVSVKDLRTILEALSEWAQSEKDTVILTEHVRGALKRYISYKYSQGQSTLSGYQIDPEIEDMVRAAIKQTSAGSYLALDPDAVQMILDAMHRTIAPTPTGAQPPVLLTAIDVRRFIRKLIESDFPDIPVLSYQEIVPEMKIQPLGRVQII